jgi:predicted GNAT superfamily acetyltransferase
MTQELVNARSTSVGGATVRDQATAAADAAASSAGLKIVELDDVGRIQDATALLNVVWSATREDPLIPANTLRALAHSGNYVFGAYEGDRMVGAIVGFLGRLDGDLQLHSHILGVSPASQGRSVGFALKQHQRAWALDQGIDMVTWTFDPLVRRNAYFNVTKLGASLNAYFPDFYGAMSDGINDGDESDRVLVEWRLGADAVVSASEGHPAEPDLRSLRDDGGVVVLQVNREGEPESTDERGLVLLASIPEDIVGVRGAFPELARRWREALRDVLGGALNDGYVVGGMTRSGWYILRREAS